MRFLRFIGFLIAMFGIAAGIGLLFVSVSIWWPSLFVLVAVVAWAVWLWKDTAQKQQEAALRYSQSPRFRNLREGFEDDFEDDLPSALD